MSATKTFLTRTAAVIIIVIIGSLIGYYLYAYDVSEQLYLVQSRGCASCHGTQGQGNSTMKGPQLAGQTRAMLMAKLKAYQNGERQSAIMAAMVWRLNDQELYLLADYFSQFDPLTDLSQTNQQDETL